MVEKITRSWELTKQSWAVLRQDKQLMLFPLISSVLTLVAGATFIVPPVVFLAATQPEWIKKDSGANIPMEWRIAFFAIMFVSYFVIYSIIAFFNSALIACALNSFDGKDASAKAGIQVAMSRLPQILGWSLVNATVGVIIQMLRERAGWIGEKLLGLVGLAWSIATFFVVPVLVVEGVGPIDACKRSLSIMKKSWGEALVTQVGVGLVFGIFTIFVLIVPLVIGIIWSVQIDSPFPVIILGGLGFIATALLSLIASTLKMILVAACYRFASTGEAPFTFEANTLQAMFAPKKK